MDEDEERKNIFIRNYNLIKFKKLSDDEWLVTEQNVSKQKDWVSLQDKFEEMKFKSLLNDKSWNKFINTFNHLFGDKN